MDRLLDDVGLDSKYWIPILSKEGITNTKQMMHLETEDIAEYVRYKWENRAFEKVLRKGKGELSNLTNETKIQGKGEKQFKEATRIRKYNKKDKTKHDHYQTKNEEDESDMESIVSRENNNEGTKNEDEFALPLNKFGTNESDESDLESLHSKDYPETNYTEGSDINEYQSFNPTSLTLSDQESSTGSENDESFTSEPEYQLPSQDQCGNNDDQTLKKDQQQNQPEENEENSTCREDVFQDICERYNLIRWHPAKISLQRVMKVEKKKSEEMTNYDIPWMILQKLIMTDHTARENVLSEWLRSQNKQGNGNANQIDAMFDNDNDPSIHVHNPLDVFVVIFGCCDLLLKQTLLQKMFMCRLAIPLIYPNLCQKDSWVLSLWALRTIVAEWQNKENETIETNVIKSLIKCVSFVRYRRPAISKSKTLNNVIDSPKHHTFFSSDCASGDTEKLVADGLVEASWYFPSGRQKDAFDDCLMFLNLRGDAGRYFETVKVISQMSKVMVIFVDLPDILDEQFHQLLTNCCSQLKVLIVFTIPGDVTEPKEILLEYKEQNDQNVWKRTSWINTLSKNKLLNPDALKKVIEDRTAEMLNDKGELISLEEWSKCTIYSTITIDENDEACENGKKIAEQFIAKAKDKKVQTILPLQQDCWFEFSNIMKSMARTKAVCEKDMHAKSKLQEKMQNLRKRQLLISKKIPDTVEIFMQMLNKNERIPSQVTLTLQWLKIFLDCKSREILPNLHKEYHQTRNSLMKNKTLPQKQEDLKAVEKKLSNATFGVEHLFREIGQMYEAVLETKNERSASGNIQNLPKMVAALVADGYPLEIMDGDNANVPLTWITAILQELKNLLSDKEVFIVSVLGIQSSGKSTMLNAMFGLQFTVSAGRCTRGVYLQLVKVDRKSGLPFDYVCVVDTEGLRAPELGNEKHEHDNELATLVIGLGDVTIMNIKGENVGEMQDILQITVHAFMRMKLAERNINVGKKCVFLHQNVSAVNAKEKTQFGTEKLNDTLDEMTREAAEQENHPAFKSFKDIINFDHENDVIHVPDLWQGDPPMASVNKGYSDKIYNVKEHILFDISKKVSNFITISDIGVRLKDLWEAVLQEDFVFSFKNSMSLKAYSEMEATCSQLAWKMESHITKWISDNVLIKLGQSDYQYLDQCHGDQLVELEKKANEQLQGVLEELETYFNECKYKNITIQWKDSKMEYMKCLKTDIVSKFKTSILLFKRSHEVDLKQKTNLAGYKTEILKKATELANEMRQDNHTLDERKLKSKFDVMWKKWQEEFETDEIKTPESIKDTVATHLYRRYESNHAYLEKVLKENPLHKQVQPQQIEAESPGFKKKMMNLLGGKTVNNSPLIEIKDIHCLSQEKGKNYALTEKDKAMVSEHVGIIIKSLNGYLEKITTEHNTFQNSQVKQLADYVEEQVKKKGKNKRLKFTQHLVIELVVFAYRKAIPIFQKMRDDYERKHSISTKIKEYRDTTWKLFRSTVSETNQDLISADLLLEQIKAAMMNTVQDAMTDEVVHEIVPLFENRKSRLLVLMLEDLAKNENFDEYKLYLQNAKEYALKWITRFTNKQIFSPQRKEAQRYKDLAESHITKITKSLQQAIEYATENFKAKVSTNTTWATAFLTKAKIPLNMTAIADFLQHPISEFSVIKDFLLREIASFKEEMILTFSSKTADSVKWGLITPYQKVSDKLWGCGAECPFCGEPCKKMANHFTAKLDLHQSVHHKPQGVNGYRLVTSRKDDYFGDLIVETCEFSVYAKKGFWCSASNCKDWEEHNLATTKRVPHQYDEYKKHVPDWEIFPNSKSDGSKYWMWFMNTFKKELAEWYGAKVPNIPKTWEDISSDDARKNLRIYAA